MTSAVALALNSDVQEIRAVLLDPIAAKVEDAVAVASIVLRHPVAKVAVARMGTSVPVTQGISVRMRDIRHAKIMISAAVSLNASSDPFQLIK